MNSLISLTNGFINHNWLDNRLVLIFKICIYSWFEKLKNWRFSCDWWLCVRIYESPTFLLDALLLLKYYSCITIYNVLNQNLKDHNTLKGLEYSLKENCALVNPWDFCQWRLPWKLLFSHVNVCKYWQIKRKYGKKYQIVIFML